MPEHIPPSPLALAVWPPASTSTHRDRYLSASRSEHRVAPELAARAILAYTDPGGLVIDPCCGVGTVLVEAIHHGRCAVGVEPNRREAALATANISNARHQGAPGRAAVLEGDPEQLPRLLSKQPGILNPPHTGPVGRVRRHPAGSAQLVLTSSRARATAELLSAWAGVLAPGGFLLLVHQQQPDKPHDSLRVAVNAAEQAGLDYWQHVIALHTTPAPTGSKTEGPLLHTDVLAFRRPHPSRAETAPAAPRTRQAVTG